MSPEAKELLRRFDSLRQKAQCPAIDDFLAGGPREQRLAVLVELIHSRTHALSRFSPGVHCAFGGIDRSGQLKSRSALGPTHRLLRLAI